MKCKSFFIDFFMSIRISMERSRLELKSESSRTILGFAWWLIEPLSMLIIYYVVFGKILKVQLENFSTFLIIGVVFWTWFNKSVMNCIDSIYEKKYIFEHCKVDPLVFPMTSIFKDLIRESLVVLLLLAFIFINGFKPTWLWIYLPLIAFMQFLINTGVGFIVAGVTPFIPDVRILFSTVMQFMMFASGVFYSIENIPSSYRFLVEINPIASVITMYRGVLMYGQQPGFTDIFYVFLFSLTIFISSIALVKINQNSYAMELNR